MGLTTSAVNFINETSKDVGKDAVELKRQTDAATEEAKRNADAVAEETKRQADAIAEEAKRQADAAAAEAQRIANAAAAKANRMTTQLQEEAKRKIGVIYDELQNKFARLHHEFYRTVRKAKDDIHVLLNEPHFAIIPPIKPDLDTWLMAIENRPVATAIIWETTAGIRLSYPFWNPTMKDDLSHAFDKAWNSDSVMPVEPFNNLVSGGGQVLSHDNAWTMFIAYVAQSIATETARHVRWSFAEYSSGELQQLFSSREMFKWLPRYSGYALQQTISGDVLPCAPHSALEFLEENAIKKENRRLTIEALLDWCRFNLIHYLGGKNASDYIDQWQYDGYPPVIRMIRGTDHIGGPPYRVGIKHRTAGCAGTVGFLKCILRTLNIPVKVQMQCTHVQPNFTADNLHLAHGDDPYSQTMLTAVPLIPISKILLSNERYNELFGRRVSNEDKCKNIGRTQAELTVAHLPDRLLSDYCKDKAMGLSHAEGEVFNWLKPNFSLDELDAMQLWERMDAAIEMRGGCAVFP